MPARIFTGEVTVALLAGVQIVTEGKWFQGAWGVTAGTMKKLVSAS